MKDTITTGLKENMKPFLEREGPESLELGIWIFCSWGACLFPQSFCTVFFVYIRKSHLEHYVNYTIDPREKIWELALQANTWWWKCVCEWCVNCSTFPMRKQTLPVYTLLRTEHKGEYAFKEITFFFFFLKWAPVKSYSITIFKLLNMLSLLKQK